MSRAEQTTDRHNRLIAPRRIAAALFAVTPSLVVSSEALAGGLVDEVKAGVLAHDVGFLGDGVEGGADIVGEVLLKSPGFLHVIGAPRPTIGGSVNTNGKTDYLYFDMTWTATVWKPTLQQGDGIYLGAFV